MAIVGAALIALALAIGGSAAASPPVIGELDAFVNAKGGDEASLAEEIVRAQYLEPSKYVGVVLDPTDEERRLVEVAAHRCELASSRFFRAEVALAFLRLEEAAGIGEDHPLRGVTLSAWCGEASYGVDDEVCRRGACDGGKARGVMQMHENYARRCVGLGPDDARTPAVDTVRDVPQLAVECALSQVVRIFESRAQTLTCRSEAERWSAAQVWFARGARPGSCRVVSGHVARLLTWRDA